MSNLLLKFKLKDSPYGVTRKTLKALADEMDISETLVVHLALSRFAKEVLPAYETQGTHCCCTSHSDQLPAS